jgi:protein KTI12
MPLIIIAGKPCTGKTTFSKALVEHLSQNDGATAVTLVNEEALNITKKDGYKNSFAEKGTRGRIKGLTDHKLNAESYVIVDSLNYIKGYRYELYCSARTFRTPHCVIWVGCDDTTSMQWNQGRIDRDEDAYDVKM